MEYNFDRRREYCVSCPDKEEAAIFLDLLHNTVGARFSGSNDVWGFYKERTLFYIRDVVMQYGSSAPGGYADEHNVDILSIEEFCEEVGIEMPGRLSIDFSGMGELI